MYTVYRITNNINNRYYIGKHITNDLDDSYYGSGLAIQRAIVKYGQENFTKTTLHICESEEEMNRLEVELIDLALEDPLTYNLNRGGTGSFHHINESGMNLGENNPMKDPDVAKRCTDSVRQTRSKNPEKYRKIAIENFKKASDQNKGKKRPEHAEFMRNYMKSHSPFKRPGSSFLVVSPEKIEYTTNTLNLFCYERGLTYTSVWNSSLTNKPVSKGKSKGWLCQKITKT